MEQAIAKLLANAGSYTPSRLPIEVDAECRNGHLVISVSDRGPGLPVELSERLFEKFYRGRPRSASSTDAESDFAENEQFVKTNESPGIGLGLYLVKSLVDQMDGIIEVRSPAAGTLGTAFAVSFPIYD